MIVFRFKAIDSIPGAKTPVDSIPGVKTPVDSIPGAKAPVDSIPVAKTPVDGTTPVDGATPTALRSCNQRRKSLTVQNQTLGFDGQLMTKV